MQRKLPALTPDSQAFWQGGAEDKLQIYFCYDCDRFFHPPGPICPDCAGENIGPKAVSGKGKIVTFTINHQKWHPDLEVPFVVAIVELAEQPGLRLVTNITGCAPQDVYVELPVRVHFLQQEDVWIPLFEVDA